LKINSTVNPITATQKVCLWMSATPKSISPNIMNSTRIGPTDGILTVEAEAEAESVIKNKMVTRKTLFDT
jgi:hypothetical protein